MNRKEWFGLAAVFTASLGLIVASFATATNGTTIAISFGLSSITYAILSRG